MIPCNVCTRPHYGCLMCLRNMWKMDQLNKDCPLLVLETKCPHCTEHLDPFKMLPAPTIDQLTKDIVYRCKNGCGWICDLSTSTDVMTTHERECK